MCTIKLLLCYVYIAASSLQLSQAKDFINSAEGNKDGRIINGQPAAPGQFPWQAAILFRLDGQLQLCGGALISSRHILTAAHCVYRLEIIKITLGSTSRSGSQPGKVNRSASCALAHPLYVEDVKGQYDVGVITLSEAVEFNSYVQPIRLATPSETLSAGTTVTVSGWGYTRDQGPAVDDLLFVQLVVITNEQCQRTFDVVDHAVCCIGSAGQSACKADSGGAVVTYDGNEWTHVALVSAVGLSCEESLPNVFMRTNRFYDWINSNMN